ncbi:flavin mononucleotide hydrolase 1, chloroplatic-like isoform X2 [Malus domestica]|uniref:flavin mononucleotide hydrolase 1, chloroplatic-like isoform X2 n=1 Tax=Malus domestica TaxID=3750 RepID=UPI0039765A36
MVFTKHDARNTTKPSSFHSTTRNLPIILFDIMDTVVRDPFYRDVPAFFGMSFDELIECKHPTAWIEFEKGITDEVELAKTFFKDGRPLDLEGLKNCMRKGYYYVEGNLFCRYEMIENKLNISKYLSWTFCSCINGKRKPDPEFYLEVVSHLKVDPGSCIFVDDRIRNVEAVKEVGMIGLHFKNADSLRQDLSLMGIDISTKQTNLQQQ